MPTHSVNTLLLGIKGTSNPCRYVILRDDIGQKKHFTRYFWAYALFDMCHLYQRCLINESTNSTSFPSCRFRCQRSVSYPTPAYYAHLLADRGRMLADQFTRKYLVK